MTTNTTPPAMIDYPAAHSMDTHWFAIDDHGEVALFDTGETGPVPEGPKAVDGLHDLIDCLKPDEYGIRVLTAVASPLASGRVMTDLDQILSRLNKKQHEALDRLVNHPDLPEDERAALNETLRSVNIWGSLIELVEAADSQHFAQDRGVIRVDEIKPIYHLMEGNAVVTALRLLRKQRIVAWRWLDSDEWKNSAVDIYGMYTFEPVNQGHDFNEYLIPPASPDPYWRSRVPAHPRQGLEQNKPSTQPEPDAPVYPLPGQSFAASEQIQIADSIVCYSWGEGTLSPGSGEMRVRQALIQFYVADPITREAQINGLRDQATSGDLIAQYVLGCLYGRSDIARHDEAVHWFTLAAQQAEARPNDDQDFFGNGAAAQFCLAHACEQGQGVAADETTALYWLERSAARGLQQARYQLGLRYKTGRGVAVNEIKARQLLRSAATLGHWQARSELENYPDFNGANSGDPQAQYELARMYAYGNGVEKNPLLAAQWYAAAAAQQHLPALFSWVDLLLAQPDLGTDDERLKQALEQLKTCAEQGNPQAQFRWGRGLLLGTFGTVDVEAARAWLTLAAPQTAHYEAQNWLDRTSMWPAAKDGEVRAGYRLAWFFQEIGQYAQAVRWYRNVIDTVDRSPVDSNDMFENGSAAKCNLADKYEHGLGVPQDYQQALYWYGQSAEQNNCVAQYSLGEMYLKGLGVARDLEIAKQWLQKSAAQGYQDASKVLNSLLPSP